MQFSRLLTWIQPACPKIWFPPWTAFSAALPGRLSIVPYYPLGKKVLRRIVDLKLGKVQKRMAENYHVTLEYGDAVRNELLRRGNNLESGARLIDAGINNDLLPAVSVAYLQAAPWFKHSRPIHVHRFRSERLRERD